MGSVSSARSTPSAASSGATAVAQLEADDQAGVPAVQREELPEEEEQAGPA